MSCTSFPIILIALFQLLFLPLAGQEKTKAEEKIDAMYDTAVSYKGRGNADTAITLFKEVIGKAKASGYTEKLAEAQNKLAWTLVGKGKYGQAMERAIEAEELFRNIKDTAGIGKVVNTLAAIHYYRGESRKALEYFKESTRIDSLLGNKNNLASGYMNIGNVLDKMDKNQKALAYFQKAQKIYEDLGDTLQLADLKVNMASFIKENMGVSQKTISLYKNALEAYREQDHQKPYDVVLNNLGRSFYKLERADSAIYYYKKGLNYAKEAEDLYMLEALYTNLSDAYSLKEDWEGAFHYLDSARKWKDSLRQKKMQERITNMQVKYETKKKEARLAKEKKENAEKQKRIEKQKLQRRMLFGGIAFLLLVVFLILRNYLVKRKANEQLSQRNALIEKKNQALEEANETITEQKEEVEEAHNEITKSIDYAQKIQYALLQSEGQASPHLPEHFTLFKPQSQVSGDFYWGKEHKGCFYLAAVDCTGHGVPGAFMSMLGISQLNEIMNTDEELTPGYILTELRERVVRELSGSDPESASKDGMDAALVKIPISNSQIPSEGEIEVEFAGAQNPLYVIRKGITEDPPLISVQHEGEGSVGSDQDPSRIKPFKKSTDGIEIKGDRQPVGYDEYAKDAFTTLTLRLRKDDLLFIFSDGYADQFGGPKGKKFRYGPFKQLLAEIHEKPLDEQKRELDRTFEDWKAESQQEQIDDVVVIGMRL